MHVGAVSSAMGTGGVLIRQERRGGATLQLFNNPKLDKWHHQLNK